MVEAKCSDSDIQPAKFTVAPRMKWSNQSANGRGGIQLQEVDEGGEFLAAKYSPDILPDAESDSAGVRIPLNRGFSGYLVIDVERLRKPMEKITDFVLKAAGVKEIAAVLPHRAARH